MRYKGFEGMDEFLDALDTCMEKAPGRCMEELKSEGNSLARAYKKRIAPHRITGNLAKGMNFDKNDIRKENGSYVGFIKNDDRKAPHFHLVEYGHDMVKGGPKGGGGHVVGHVKGKLYLAKTLAAEEKRLQKKRERAIEKILRELE